MTFQHDNALIHLSHSEIQWLCSKIYFHTEINSPVCTHQADQRLIKKINFFAVYNNCKRYSAVDEPIKCKEA